MKRRVIELIYSRLDYLGVMDPWLHTSKEFTDYAAFLQIYLLYRILDLLV
jgi:hypothetical protein